MTKAISYFGRMTRENDALENKTKLISKTTVHGVCGPSRQLDHDKEDLRQINFKLEEEVCFTSTQPPSPLPQCLQFQHCPFDKCVCYHQ